MAKYRKVPLTEKRLKDVGESYRLMYVLAKTLEFEHDHYLDTDFRNPFIHKQIGIMRNAMEQIRALLSAKAVHDDGKDEIIDLTQEVKNVVSKIVNP